VFFHDPALELNEGDVVEAGVDCEVETDFETIFSSNVNHEYRCEPVDNWGCIFSGKIVALRGGTPIVDCGGICVPMDNLTHDQRVIGDWVQFKAYLVTLSDPRPLLRTSRIRPTRRDTRHNDGFELHTTGEGRVRITTFGVWRSWKVSLLLVFRHGFYRRGVYMPRITEITDEAIHPSYHRGKLKILAGWDNWCGYDWFANDEATDAFLRDFYDKHCRGK
jgi:hypothetical protein